MVCYTCFVDLPGVFHPNSHIVIQRSLELPLCAPRPDAMRGRTGTHNIYARNHVVLDRIIVPSEKNVENKERTSPRRQETAKKLTKQPRILDSKVFYLQVMPPFGHASHPGSYVVELRTRVVQMILGVVEVSHHLGCIPYKALRAVLVC
jgi:hypothetical protein